MEKTTIKLDMELIERTSSFRFMGGEIVVLKHLSLDTKIALTANYISDFFNDDMRYINYVKAEYALILGVIDLCTNIEISNLEVDDIISSGLWDAVSARIIGYNSFKSEIQKIIDYMREDFAIDKSVGSVIDKAMAKIMEFLDGLTDLDLSVEGIKNLMSELSDSQNSIDKIINPSAIQAEIQDDGTK